MLTSRFLIVAALFGTVMFGEDITVPLDDGNILIHAHFIRRNQYDDYVPELTFTMENQTSSPWRTLKLQFDIGGFCNGEPRQWTIPVNTGLGWTKERQLVGEYSDTLIPLLGKVDGCKTELMKVTLLLAENFTKRFDGVPGELVDFRKQLRELKAKRDAEAAAIAEADRKAAKLQAETDRNAAAIRAKKDATEAARRKRLAEEQTKKQVEVDARYAKMKAEEAAKVAEERRQVRVACAAIYQNTIDKKVKDLTVREEQQVRTCQALGLYPPQ